MKDENDVSDRILELLVEGVLDASPEEIARIAAAEGIDEAKLHNAVRKGIMLGFKAELALHQMSDEHSHQAGSGGGRSGHQVDRSRQISRRSEAQG